VLSGIKELVRPSAVPFLRNNDEALALLFSMRHVEDLVASCVLYEFEDVAMRLAPCDRVEPERLEGLHVLRRMYKLGRMITGSAEAARRLTLSASGLRLDRDYDLFLPVFNNPFEIFALGAVAGWRKRCRYAACLISEMWEGEIPTYLVEQLSQFDRIYLGVTEPVASVGQITGRPCSYMPLGVDLLLFAPEPGAPRPIDVCGIGRRSEVTHQALLALARERGLFYYFDTVRTKGIPNASRQMTFSVSRPSEHRYLYATLLKHSRYLMASRARANEPEFTRGRQEIAGRFFEGAAAGAVMIGDPPNSRTFEEYFDWPDAVIRMPFDEPGIAKVLDGLADDPERVDRIRRDGVVGSLLKSDWVYRLQTVFEAAGLTPTPAMEARKAELRRLAERMASTGQRRAAAIDARR
jgi:hypothetical protein